MAFRSDPKTRL
jgi:hypothetical protein